MSKTPHQRTAQPTNCVVGRERVDGHGWAGLHPPRWRPMRFSDLRDSPTCPASISSSNFRVARCHALTGSGPAVTSELSHARPVPPGESHPAQGQPVPPPLSPESMVSVWISEFPAVSLQMFSNISHMATPRSVMISTARTVERTLSPRSPRSGIVRPAAVVGAGLVNRASACTGLRVVLSTRPYASSCRARPPSAARDIGKPPHPFAMLDPCRPLRSIGPPRCRCRRRGLTRWRPWPAPTPTTVEVRSVAIV